MKAFVTGGAGYVGSLLVDRLLDASYEVVVYDNLSYGVSSLFTRFIEPSFRFVRGDVRDRDHLGQTIREVRPDVIFHLAAVVGYPACARQPKDAMDINVGGTRNVAEVSRGIPIVFASTGSAYGKVEGICTEDSPCEPLSLYGQTKRTGELLLLERGDATILRFATAFGLSHRLRLDLLPNDFTFQAVHNRQLIVYEPQYRRTFIHVRDMARALHFVWERFERTREQTFNVGDELMNLTKREVAEAILRKTDYYLHYADVGTDADQRDYEVSYEKIRQAGFRTEIDLDHGLNELVTAFKNMTFANTGEISAVRASHSNLVGV